MILEHQIVPETIEQQQNTHNDGVISKGHRNHLKDLLLAMDCKSDAKNNKVAFMAQSIKQIFRS